MEINLTLTAKTLQLAAHLDHSVTSGGVLYVKNVPERTYLAVTPKQWILLKKFQTSHTVPAVLEAVIDERICPPLGEFYELILKAVRAHILVTPGYTVPSVGAATWPLVMKPKTLRYGLWALLWFGIGLTVALPPSIPKTIPDALAGLALTVLAAAIGAALTGSLIRGAGGEVYVSHRWFIRTADLCMLPPADQQVILIAPLAVFAACTGLLAWHKTEWSLFPLLGFLVTLRPIFFGRVSQLIRVHAKRRLSDSEHDHIFPPNRTPRSRLKLLSISLGNPTTWVEIVYGIVWTMLLAYFVGLLTKMPPWTMAFWTTQGPLLAIGILGSLAVLGAAYVGTELYIYAHNRTAHRRKKMRKTYRRWFGRKRLLTDENARLRAVLRSPLLRTLPPTATHAIAKAFHAQQAGAWKCLHDFDQPVTEVSLILSGTVGVYRKLRSGRRVLHQVLQEDDLVGLHAVADQMHPQFLYRTMTPVVLLRMERAVADDLILSRVKSSAVTNLVLKLPFLARLSLCRNWHMQAVQRFAELSRIQDYKPGDVILQEGYYSENFFIIFEGEAQTTKAGKRRGVMRAGSFFGEIGLLQNSNATAQVSTREEARCLCIPRREFLRFVAHNYTVALELERVSSQRLGRPIFPLTPGNYRTI
jgi:CRP-like cAMP-binding protein/uncharacterized integral membrane protein